MSSQAGIIAIWNDIVPAARANFLAWHSREHIPERVAIPGFVRGRRLFAAESAPQYLTLYDVESPSVLIGEAYLARLNAPTPWTQRSVKDFQHTERAACRVLSAAGAGSGGRIVTLRCWTGEPLRGRPIAANPHAGMDALAQSLLALAGVCTVTIAANEQAASSVTTSERKIRSADGVPPDLAALVEVFDPAVASAEALKATLAERFGAIYPAAKMRLDHYDLEFSLGREP